MELVISFVLLVGAFVAVDVLNGDKAYFNDTEYVVRLQVRNVTCAQDMVLNNFYQFLAERNDTGIVLGIIGEFYLSFICTCDDIHPARADSASMACTSSRITANQARRSWARPPARDAHFMLHLRMSTTACSMSRTGSSFSVVTQVFSDPPVRLRQVRGNPRLQAHYKRRPLRVPPSDADR